MDSPQKNLAFITDLDGFTVTKATIQDWNHVVKWGNREGWNIGYNDSQCMYSIDNNGLFIGWLGDQAIAAVSLINHSEQYSIWGNYLVIPEFRGNGYGKAVCKIAKNHAGDRNIGSNAMPEMVSNYMKSGLTPVYNVIHYSGKPRRITPNIKEIIPVELHYLDKIIQYDALYFPTSRQRFLKKWLFSDGHVAYVKIINGEIYGYGVIRPAPSGYRIGPLVAKSPIDAEELFNTLTSFLPLTTQVSIFVPEYVHESFIYFLRKREFFEQFHVVYMHKGILQNNIPNSIYALSNLELG
ncbi:GNAT family N-acetyltransferase [Xenorhabdus sp. DI]|uniref:GNAT family N-acetyltransferase n=1 Tax=Xenorhabdus doucetiae TaxID=351671 RepID=UPI0019A6EFF8|nr:MULTISPECIES: GNAT family N-acetyltransferase [unclassified Xenorhabdus]MBD2784082.1 GNAT family N-acetyltransferase [Xenorhabdus sp. 3]MBD2787793.1 GNAT family N-acetyltransferase [Xenorhabdus sp. DI]